MLLPAVPQSGRFLPHFRTNVYATWLTRHLRKSSFVLPTHPHCLLAPVSPFVSTVSGFLQRYKPDAKLGTIIRWSCPIHLSFWYGLMLLKAWYLVGLPIGPHLPTFVLRERMLRLLEEKIATPLSTVGDLR